ncbi:MAG: MFS transporter [Eubacteriaceae bacterium]|nr:MFS transporter [Eubacteriaceae bacterium]
MFCCQREQILKQKQQTKLVAKVIDFALSFFVGPIIESANFKDGKYIPWLRICRPLYYMAYIITYLPFDMPIGLRALSIVLGHLMVRIPNSFILTSQYGALSLASGSDLDMRNKMSIASIRIASVCYVLTSATTTPFRNLIKSAVGAKYQYIAMSALYGLFFFAATNSLLAVLKPYDQPVIKDSQGDRRKIGINDMVKCIATNSQLIVHLMDIASRGK